MRYLTAITLGTLLLCGSAAAAQEKPVRELEPVHVNAMRNPEVRKYQVILAGLDAFDRHRSLAPAAEGLRFRLTPRKKDESVEPLSARLVGDDGFSLPIALDAGRLFTVPRSAAAEAADSELELNRKRRVYRTEPDIRTPGLSANQRRLGDLRLECKVTVAMAKEEIPLFWVLTINTFLMRTDWCGFFGDRLDTRFDNASRSAHFSYRAGRPLAEALLVEGNRSALLRVEGDEFEVPIGDADWSDEAVVELRHAGPAAPADPAGPATGTAGGTSRTAP